MSAVLNAEKISQRYASLAWQLLRWALVVPACLVIAVVVNFLVAFINSFGGDIPSGIVWLFAAGTSGYACTYSTLYIAPGAQRATAATIALGAVLGSVYVIGHAIREPASITLPLWYVSIIAIVFAIAALIGACSPYDESDLLPQSPLPTALRWILFLPCAIVGAFCIAFALEFAMQTFAPGLADLAGVEIRLLFGAIFIGIATAIAPAGRRIVVSVISLPWLVTGSGYFITGLFRPVVTSWFHRIGDPGIAFYDTPFVQCLQGLALLGACIIPIAAAFTSGRKVSS
jgi:hypothetical protein